MAEKKKKKKKSRIKKIFKNLAKVAAIGTLGYGASKMFGGKKGPVSTVGQPTGVGRVADKPANLGETFHQKQPYQDDIMRGGVGVKYSPRRTWTGDQTMAPNRNIFFKHGGKVTGVAKRGFGRALMKGKK
jgi:hypothetical protein